MQQANILLEKITTLQKSIQLNQGTIAPIERDLMLSYIRQLYELYLQEETTAVPTKPAVAAMPEAKVAPKPQEVEPPKPTYTPPKVIETPKPPVAKVEEPVVQRQPVTPVFESTYNTIPTRNANSTPTPPVQRKAPVDNGKLNALFDFRKNNDLSERLSDRPITDLTKAFAINDRLLYINSLFGKDANSFMESLQLLNKFETMNEAKSLMLSLGEQYNWTEGERVEIAQGFIKTVRRKYV